ncbi:E3 ubiquitin-protein ligase dbl4 [Acrodontium crateriforme]|uniref:Mannose-1-phosphate guanyltransferase n=1 Tax=Acrodontium crateriforme TaxID=150365 RepID=A0AAQ3RBD5_9PEZI|nr:E3 ubiquitin-protein ligase dbl4 [Acrodontium crateriforme]
MAPKSKKGGNAHKGKNGADDEREEPLQAVILADSFETRFNPFTLERPRCLLPLANTPLIEYTFELLANAGAEEVFLYCGNHTDQVEEYLKTSKWMKDTSPFSLELIRSTSKSIGDAMRDLDQKGLITGDFICVYGDVVANVPLEAALAAHRARREKDKKAIMTMVLREAGDLHRTKVEHMRSCFVVDASTKRCVHYEQVRRPNEGPRLDIPEEVLSESVEVEIREDLIDCGIDICTPEVLAQWSDNFDWQMPRRGFLYGLLKDYETMQLTVHTHILTEGYAARVKSLRAYEAISKDVISRWTYPLSPDTNMLSEQSYQLHKGQVYKEDGVVLARSSVVNRKVVIGQATTVGDGSVITNSVIGRRCVIGKKVKIDGAYIWDDTRIGDETTIENAMVGSEAVIGNKCTIAPGALISYGVHIGDGTTVKQNARITLKRKRGQDDAELSVAPTDVKVVGEGGEGYGMEFDEDEEEDAAETLLAGMSRLELTQSSESISTLDSDDDDDDYEHAMGTLRSASFGSIGSEESGEDKHRAADFHHEAVVSMFDALQKEEDPDTIQLEFRALTLGSNAQAKQVRRVVAVSFMKRIANLIESGKSVKDAVAGTIPRNRQLVKGCVSIKDFSEQAEFILLMQTDLVDAALPATPQTLTSDAPMDSDDDFNSIASSDDLDLGDEQDSSVDFDDDSDVELEDLQDDDAAFGTQKDMKPKKKAYEVDFKVYSPEDIQAQQDKQVDEVATLLEQPPEATRILLRYARWNKEKLIEQYMDSQEEVLDKAGLGQDISRNPPKIETIHGFVCDICCEDTPGLPTFAMQCGHRFCVDCYRQYLAQKIKEEGEAARIKCPGDGCHKIIDAKSLDLLVTSDLTDRYHELLMRTYVDDKENLKWCPAPNCVYAVECPVKQRELDRIVPTVMCDCKHPFCFGCTLVDHQPAPCSLVKKWLKKCEDDSETANWISANTKECPKCQSTIEKNGGCNHMTCRKCRNEFCWMCMGVWSEHGTSWYNCNRFEERSGTDARDAQARSRQSLERYLHYYNRYANHEQSAKLDKDIYHKTEKKMTMLQSTSGMSWIEVQFLEAASQALQQCRQTLKWTYAFAYYLARNNQTEIFEDNQKDLEMAVENLSEMFEKPTDQLASLKVEMMDKTSYCKSRRVILLDDTAQNLKDQNWVFNVELKK